MVTVLNCKYFAIMTNNKILTLDWYHLFGLSRDYYGQDIRFNALNLWKFY